VIHAPWEYFFKPFNRVGFPDLFYPLLFLAIALLAVQVVIYNVQARKLHRHVPLVAMQEWLLWTGVCTFGLIVVEAVFVWDFIFVLATVVLGVGTYVWVRFYRFPPIIEAYNEHLRRTRFFSNAKYKHPEATIRPRRRRRR